MFQIHIESGGIFYGKDRCTPKKNTSWNGERKKTVVYTFQMHLVLAVGEPFMAPVGQYVFAEM